MDIAELGYRIDSGEAVRATRDLQGMEQQADRTERSADRLGREADETGRKLRNMGSAVAFLDGPLGGVASRFRSLGTLIGQVGIAAAGALVLFGALSLGARHLATGFDAALRLDAAVGELSTLLPGATAQLDEMAEAGRRMGVQFGTGSQAQIQAYYAAVSAGATNAAQATERVEAANRLAIGGVTDLQSAIAVLNSATNAYAAEGLSAADASDILFTGVRFGVTTVSELSHAIGRAIPAAAALGVGFDELVGGIAALTTQGQNTNLAVTGLTAAMSQLLNPSQQARELAQQLGLEFNATAVQALGLAGFMDEVVRATGGSQEQMATLFGSVEALRAVFSLAGQGGVRFNEIMAEMENRTGAAQAAYDRMAGTLSQRYARILAFVGEKQEEVGNAMLRVLVPAAETLIATLTRAEGASEALDLVFRTLAVTAGVLVVRQLALLVVSVGTATVTAIAGSTAFRAYVLSLSLVGPVTATATLATSAFGAAVRFALGPVGLMITAIGFLTLAWHNHRSAAERAREENERLYELQEDMVALGSRVFDTTLNQAEARLAEARATREQVLEQYRLTQMGAVTARQALEAEFSRPGRSGPSISARRADLEAAETAAAMARDLVLQNTGTVVALERQIERLRGMETEAAETSGRSLSVVSDEYRDTVEGLTQSITLLRTARGEERAVAEQLLAAGLAADATGAQAERIRELVREYRSLDMDERIADLREEAATIGMSSREIELYRMRLEGASAAQLYMADAIMRAGEEWQKQQDLLEDVSRSLSRVAEENMTPLQRYEAQIRSLNDALSNGLDHSAYIRGVERAQDAFIKADERLSTLRSTASGFLRDIRSGTSVLGAFANAFNSIIDRMAENSLDAVFRRFVPDLAGNAVDMGVETAKGTAHGTASGIAIGTAMTGAAQLAGVQIGGAMTMAGTFVATQISSAMALAGMFNSSGSGLSALGQGVASFIGFGGFFAEGGDLAAGRWGIVGERGVERIDAKPGGGVRVTPLSTSRGGGNIEQHFHLHAEGAVMTEELLAQMEAKAEKARKKAVEQSAAISTGMAKGAQRPKLNG